MTGAANGFRLPVALVVADVLGAILAGLGVFGLASDAPEAIAPALAEPAIAWTLVAVGVALMAWAIGGIVRLALRSGTRR